MTAWKIPLVVAAIAVPIAISFLTVGPALGMALGALAAVAIIAIAAAQKPRGTIGGSDDADVRRVLVVVGDPLEDVTAVEEVAAVVRTNGASEVMVLAPARIGFLDRWASDVEAARRDAQERLVISIASLAAAGVEAEARVGDEDVVQAVEDQLGSFPASEVILVSAGGEEDQAAAAAARELRSRLRAKFRWVATGPAAR
jgi:ABC-type transport system involved in cytochrome bd biosynthesis fused ATPase/permease subunit